MSLLVEIKGTGENKPTSLEEWLHRSSFHPKVSTNPHQLISLQAREEEMLFSNRLKGILSFLALEDPWKNSNQTKEARKRKATKDSCKSS